MRKFLQSDTGHIALSLFAAAVVAPIVMESLNKVECKALVSIQINSRPANGTNLSIRKNNIGLPDALSTLFKANTDAINDETDRLGFKAHF
jgi:hypothetical protein